MFWFLRLTEFNVIIDLQSLRSWVTVKNVPAFCQAPGIITELTEFSPFFLSSAIAIQCTPFRTIQRSILMYISHLYLGLWCVSFFKVFEANSTYISLLPVHAICPDRHVFFFYGPNHIGRGGYCALWNSVSCNFLHLLLLTVVQIFSWTSCFRTPSAYVLPLMRKTKPGPNLGQGTNYTEEIFLCFYSVRPVKFRRVF